MRKALLAATLMALWSAPALADEIDDARALVDAAQLSEEADLYMWCGAAFTVVGSLLEGEPEAEQMHELAGILFAKAEPMLTDEGVADADLGSFGAAYATIAAHQIIQEQEEPAYTREDCSEAAM